MPLTLSSVAIEEKNKLATDSAFLVALEITIPGVATPVRIVRNSEDIFWRSETWTAFPFELDEVGDEAKGEVPQVIIRIANVSRVMEAYLQAYDLYCKNNGWSPITIKIYVVNTVNVYSGVELDDETGATWGPTYHGLSLADGQAFIRVQGVDLSAYANGKHLIKLHDSAGKMAVGYLSEAGGGETLGDELVTNGDNEAAATTFDEDGNGAASSAQSDEQAHAGTYSTKVTLNGTAHYGYRYFNDTDLSKVTAGKLYKMSCWVYLPSGQAIDKIYLQTYGVAGSFQTTPGMTTTDTWVQITTYLTVETRLSLMILAIDTQAVNNTDYFYIDDISIKEVTDCAVDGALIISEQEGDDQDWASIEAGFDYNDDDYTFEVFYSGEYECEVEHFFELKQPKTDSKWATFILGAPNPSNMRFPRNRIMKNMCPFQPFKGTRCAYAGVETACNRTLARCRELVNSDRFGGFPGVGYGGVTVIR